MADEQTPEQHSYDIKAPNGKTLTITGDRMPTEAELQEIFKAKGIATSPSWWQSHPRTRDLVKGTLDTLPAVGSMVGGSPGALSFMAAPASGGTTLPVSAAATVGGAALGAGAGRGLRDLIAETVGIEDPTSPLSKSARIALDTVITAAAPAVIGRVKDILTKPKAALVDVVDTLNAGLHPQKTMQEVADTIRAWAAGPKATPIVSNFAAPATEAAASEAAPVVDARISNLAPGMARPPAPTTRPPIVTPPPTGSNAARAAAMRAENPNIDAEAAALRARAAAAKPEAPPRAAATVPAAEAPAPFVYGHAVKQVGDAFQSLKVQPLKAELNNAAEAIRQAAKRGEVLSPAQAVVKILKQRPGLSAEVVANLEAKVAAQEQAAAAFAEKMGTPSPSAVERAVTERNKTGTAYDRKLAERR